MISIPNKSRITEDTNLERAAFPDECHLSAWTRSMRQQMHILLPLIRAHLTHETLVCTASVASK